MHTKVGASPAYILSQLSSAVVGAACFVASIGLISSAKTALFKPILSISPAQFTWVGSVKMDFNHEIQFSSAVSAPNIDALVQTNVEQELQKISKLEERARVERKRNFARLARAQRHSRKSIARAQAESIRIRLVDWNKPDEIEISQAAPIARASETLVSEAEKMRNIHTALMAQFNLAMNEVGPPKVIIQVAERATTQHLKASDLGLDGVPEAPRPLKKGHHQAVLVAQKQESPAKDKANELPAARIVEDKTDSLQLSAAAERPAQIEKKLSTQPEVTKTDVITQLARKLSGEEEVQPPPTDQPVRPIHVATSGWSQAPPPQNEAPPKEGDQVAAKAEPRPVHADPQEKSSEAVSYLGGALILPREYPQQRPQGGYSNPTVVAMNTQSRQLPQPQPQTWPKAKTPENPIFKPSLSDSASPHTGMSLDAALTVAMMTAQASKPAFKEAFDWSRGVLDAQAEILTREDAFETYGQSQVGWRIARASEHWPTVYWNRKGEVPLLSRNSARMLSIKAGTTLQNEAGLVIAKAPAGWSLEFSGRSEHPLIFNSASQPLANDTIEDERYYVFLNASPGAQILYLVRSGETGAVALPVLGGMVSFADLTQPEHKEIHGKFLDAGGAKLRGLGGLRVQLIGSGQTTVTNGGGVFHFDNVVTFGSQPLFIEAESSRGYPHRYKISPKTMKTSLFVIGEEQVHDWIAQLEGGISSESGLIVGALPAVASANEDKKPIATIKSLAIDPTLQPECYSVSSSGQLLVKSPMSSGNSRLIGVQVPEGPAIVQLADKDGKVLWSELLVISPRVLSVVGPY